MARTWAILQNGCEKFAVIKSYSSYWQQCWNKNYTDKGELHLQEFWVKISGKDKVEGIQYIGSDSKAKSWSNKCNSWF